MRPIPPDLEIERVTPVKGLLMVPVELLIAVGVAIFNIPRLLMYIARGIGLLMFHIVVQFAASCIMNTVVLKRKEEPDQAA